MSGNLSHQIEHHLFPDLPAHRYAEISVEVREICERYGLPYNTGPLRKQFGTVVRKIVRLALPERGAPRELGSRGSLTGAMPDRLDRVETTKDTIQVVVESGASHAGAVASIVTRAVREVTRELGDFATDVFEIRDAARRAQAGSEDAGPPDTDPPV